MDREKERFSNYAYERIIIIIFFGGGVDLGWEFPHFFPQDLTPAKGDGGWVWPLSSSEGNS